MKILYPSPLALMNNLMGCDNGSDCDCTPATKFPVHVWSESNALFLEAELPGADPAKLDVSVKSGELTLKGVRVTHRHGEQAFERRFQLPPDIQATEIKAKFLNGILSLELPFQPAEEPQKVAIAVA